MNAAHAEGLDVSEYLRRNWEMYEYDGELNEDAREALEFERGGRRYSISRTRNMSWEEQVKDYFRGNGTIRSSDSLYLGESNVDGIQNAPLYIPTSVINKAVRVQKGSRSAHELTEADIRKLKDGIKNAPVVIHNPARNAIVYVTENMDNTGNYIVAAFDLNNNLFGETAHKATSIHGRENVAALLKQLGADATVYIKNKNKLNQMLPGNQILKSLELLAKIELDDGTIAQDESVVNRSFSVSEAEDERYLRLAEDPEGNEDELQRMVDEAARNAGYWRRMFHAGNKNIDVFQAGNSAGLIYFANSEHLARNAARNKKKIYKVFLKATNPVNTKESAVNWYDAEDSLRVAEWKRNGYDSVYVKDEAGVSFAVFNSNQVKSADPVTYDDAGNVIPLSERFITQNDDIRYSISRTTENKPFVEVEEDILDGVPEEAWVSTVKRILKQKFPDGVTVGNSEIHIDYQSRQEMTFSKYMKWLFNNDQQLRADKLRSTNNADEILQTATGWINEGLNHPRKDNIADFARGTVLLRVGGNDYSADVVVGTRKNGSMMLYDVLNLRPTSFIKKETDAVKAENPSPGTNRSAASISGDRVAEDDVSVNRNFSISEIMADKELRLPGGENVNVRDVLNTRERQYLRRKENEFTGSIAKAMGVPAGENRSYLRNITERMSEEYLSTGRISDETREEMFETAYRNGIVTDRTLYDQYKELRDYLRSARLVVTDEQSRAV